MRVADDRKVEKVIERLLGSVMPELTGNSVTTQDLGDLEVNEVRGVKCLPGGEEPFTNSGCRSGAEKDFQGRRGVHHDHRWSLSALTAFTGGVRVRTGVRFASRSLNSLKVGRSASRCTSLRK